MNGLPRSPRPTRAITAAERAAFAADGVVCLRAALEPELLAAMEGPVETALTSAATADLSAVGRDLEGAGVEVLRDASRDTPSGAPAGGRFAGGVDHWREQPEFADFACRSALPGLVASLLGSAHLWLYEDSLLVKEPGTAERTAWHQDLGYFHVDGPNIATTWCPLDAVTPESGAVGYVRGSHRWSQTFRPNLFVSPLTLPDTEGDTVPDIDALVAAGDCEVVTFSTAPGDVIVHHVRTVHAAGANRSTDLRRRAISVRYCGDDTRVRVRPGAPRKPHQAAWSDGDPFADGTARADHPEVWPPTTG